MDEFMMDDWMWTKVKRPIYGATCEGIESSHSHPTQLPSVLTVSPRQIDRHERS